MNNLFIDQLPIVVTKFDEHLSVKETLLSLIDKMPDLSYKDGNLNNIRKTDWPLKDIYYKEYLDFIKPKLAKALFERFRECNYTELSFENMWFQQYTNGDFHGWHTHENCHFTNVYYVELPSVDYRTEIQNWNRTKTIDYYAKEGDIVSFPSMLYHRSPPIQSNERKTIISFNLNIKT